MFPCRAKAFATLALLAGACKDKPRPQEDRTEPWLRKPSPSLSQPRVVKFKLTETSSMRFSVPTRKTKPSGKFSKLRGSLSVDLNDLSRTRGQIDVDLSSVEMLDGDFRQGPWTIEAKNWLGLGEKRNAHQLKKNRWARFEIASVSDLSASTPSAGRKLRASKAKNFGPEIFEVREVRLRAIGNLTMRDYRVKLAAQLRCRFGFKKKWSDPVTLEVENRRPVFVSLPAYGIRPRDAAGRANTEEGKEWSKKVGKEARVFFRLLVEPAGRGGGEKPRPLP